TQGDTQVISLLIEKGAPLDLKDEQGWTPLAKAAALGHADAVKALCDAGADPTIRNRFGRKALDYARGIPGTESLATVEKLRDGEEKGLFNQDELYYVFARKAAGSGPSYDHIVKMLEDRERQFHNE